VFSKNVVINSTRILFLKFCSTILRPLSELS